jgi:hypothetical protein
MPSVHCYFIFIFVCIQSPTSPMVTLCLNYVDSIQYALLNFLILKKVYLKKNNTALENDIIIFTIVPASYACIPPSSSVNIVSKELRDEENTFKRKG